MINGQTLRYVWESARFHLGNIPLSRTEARFISEPRRKEEAYGNAGRLYA